jgi:hypothetical protein
MSKLGKRLLQAAREGRATERMRSLEEIIASLPADRRAKVKARTRKLIVKMRRPQA